MAHVDAWQWRPDLFWFDNLNVMSTPNYHVQILVSLYTGDQVIPITMNGEPLTSQNELYASASVDSKAGKVYLKLVNTSNESRRVDLGIRSEKNVNGPVAGRVMTTDKLLAYNTLERPETVVPKDFKTEIQDNRIQYEMDTASFYVIEIELN